MNPKKRVVLVEDDPNFVSVLKSYLKLNDYHVVGVADGREAIANFKQNDYDICVLDVLLPHVDGFSIAKMNRVLNPAIPFIFLTAKTLREDIVEGYALGADDYITKPFDSEVLVLKLKAILNRTTNKAIEKRPVPEKIKLGKYHFDYALRELILDDKIQKLSPRESDLLKLLCAYRNRVLPRQLALKSIWGDDSYFTTRSMDVFISKLRKFLKQDDDIQIVNIHGNGFRMIIPPDNHAEKNH